MLAITCDWLTENPTVKNEISRREADCERVPCYDFTYLPHPNPCFARLRNNLYCVEWEVKLYYTVPYPCFALGSSLDHQWLKIEISRREAGLQL